MKAEKWKSWGLTMKGPKHFREGLPNQDAWLARHYLRGDVLVVSDGLGSKPKSHLGSRAACRATAAAARIYFESPATPVQDFLLLVHSLWLVMIDGDDAENFGATCLFAVRSRGEILLAQLGDGLIGLCKTNGETVLVSEEKKDSFANITSCLGKTHQSEQWRALRFDAEDCEAVALMTDGISEDLRAESQTDFVRELYLSHKDLAPGPRSLELRRWLRKWPVPGHFDDKTVSCLFKSEVQDG
jgi:serine/threonine protein phosphatase PrpC